MSISNLIRSIVDRLSLVGVAIISLVLSGAFFLQDGFSGVNFGKAIVFTAALVIGVVLDRYFIGQGGGSEKGVHKQYSPRWRSKGFAILETLTLMSVPVMIWLLWIMLMIR